MATVIILILVGVVLLCLETLLPGLVTGAIGVLCLIGAVVAGYFEFGFRGGNFVLFTVLLVLVIGTVVWINYFPRSPMARMFVSKTSVGELGVEKPELLRQKGTAFTALRPSGIALINGQRVDVVTEGGMVDRGTPVEVVKVEGMRVVVRAIQETETNSGEFTWTQSDQS